MPVGQAGLLKCHSCARGVFARAPWCSAFCDGCGWDYHGPGAPEPVCEGTAALQMQQAIQRKPMLGKPRSLSLVMVEPIAGQNEPQAGSPAGVDLTRHQTATTTFARDVRRHVVAPRALGNGHGFSVCATVFPRLGNGQADADADQRRIQTVINYIRVPRWCWWSG